ncbi:hypothetical protein GQE99_14450 [Maritimibacter sp. DP07]|uniref:Bacteriophage phiJL001 Gp84 C-terminal domain-containing protein n=1 Tax=Maritimibacter harenae TaxID=2606218 RepID=A0A845M1I6_9RHOB|nr:phage BR0599 family protein [Maritimibacter harenae]MZR14220.1 hypothetical protein [Maritimibacter harenae]
MSYSSFLSLISGKRPLWLYKIVLGSQTAFLASRATDFDLPHSDFFDLGPDLFANEGFFQQTYTASPVRHSRIPVSARIDRNDVDLVFPLSDAFARNYLGSIGIVENSVTIWHGFEGDGEFVVKFRGRVMGVKPEQTTITLACENGLTSMRRKGLSAIMQRPCRHAVYHTGCGLNIADFEVSGTATAISGATVTVAEAASQADGYYTGGVLTFNGARQMVAKHVGSSLTLIGALPGLEGEISEWGSADVQIAPGCDLSLATCELRFSNTDNYGGFPWMSENPFDGRALW